MKCLQDGLDVARNIFLALQADHLIQVPEVWQLVPLVGLGKREGREDLPDLAFGLEESGGLL